MKKFVFLIIVILFLAAGVFTFVQNRQTASDKAKQPTDENKNAYDPKNPDFIPGNVTAASTDKIEFKSGQQSYTAKLSAATKLVKQVKDDKTGIKVVDATLADFKANAMIVVYFSEKPVDGVYKANKVQIIGL